MGGQKGTGEERTGGCEPTRVVDELVRRLRGRRDGVLAATRGTALRVQVALTVSDDHSEAFRIMVTSQGNVASLAPENLTGEEFRPQLVLAGTVHELLAVVSGTVSWREAIDAGTVIPYVDPTDYESFRELVATELLDLLDDSA